MLAIEQEIQKLLRLKAKVNLYQMMLANVQNELDSKSKDHDELEKTHAGLLTEFVAEVSAFCEAKIDLLGNGPVNQKPAPVQRPSESEVVNKPADSNLQKETVKVVDPSTEEPTDPLKFLLKWRHLEGKKVAFETRNGEVTGTVRGMVTPNLKVELDTGYTASVRPTDIKVL